MPGQRLVRLRPFLATETLPTLQCPRPRAARSGYLPVRCSAPATSWRATRRWRRRWLLCDRRPGRSAIIGDGPARAEVEALFSQFANPGDVSRARSSRTTSPSIFAPAIFSCGRASARPSAWSISRRRRKAARCWPKTGRASGRWSATAAGSFPPAIHPPLREAIDTLVVRPGCQACHSVARARAQIAADHLLRRSARHARGEPCARSSRDNAADCRTPRAAAPRPYRVEPRRPHTGPCRRAAGRRRPATISPACGCPQEFEQAALVSSPLARAVETARIVGGRDAAYRARTDRDGLGRAGKAAAGRLAGRPQFGLSPYRGMGMGFSAAGGRNAENRVGAGRALDRLA